MIVSPQGEEAYSGPAPYAGRRAQAIVDKLADDPNRPPAKLAFEGTATLTARY